ncbi:TetR/AcrR family transcriptional regulator, partial [Streptomyces sp. NPDC059447]
NPLAGDPGGVRARGGGPHRPTRPAPRRASQSPPRLRRVDNRRMDYLRTLFREFCPDEDDVEVRCMLTFSVRLGSYVVAADHGAHSRAEVMDLTRKWLLR